MYFVGKKADHSFVNQSGTYGSGDPSDTVILNATIEAKGGVANDYSVYHIIDTSNAAKRAMVGDEYVLVWTGDVITDIDFSIEDTRKFLMVRTVNPNNKANVKEIIVGDGIDSVIIQTRVCLADKVTIDTSINKNPLLPIQTPDGRLVYLKINLTAGVGTEVTFKTTLEGIWSVVKTKIMVGTEKLIIKGDNRNGNTDTINVLMNL